MELGRGLSQLVRYKAVLTVAAVIGQINTYLPTRRTYPARIAQHAVWPYRRVQAMMVVVYHVRTVVADVRDAWAIGLRV